MSQVLNASTDENLQDILTEDDSLEILEATGYHGVLSKERITSKWTILQ